MCLRQKTTLELWKTLVTIQSIIDSNVNSRIWSFSVFFALYILCPLYSLSSVLFVFYIFEIQWWSPCMSSWTLGYPAPLWKGWKAISIQHSSYRHSWDHGKPLEVCNLTLRGFETLPSIQQGWCQRLQCAAPSRRCYSCCVEIMPISLICGSLVSGVILVMGTRGSWVQILDEPQKFSHVWKL